MSAPKTNLFQSTWPSLHRNPRTAFRSCLGELRSPSVRDGKQPISWSVVSRMHHVTANRRLIRRLLEPNASIFPAAFVANLVVRTASSCPPNYRTPFLVDNWPPVNRRLRSTSCTKHSRNPILLKPVKDGTHQSHGLMYVAILHLAVIYPM
jgi:hypothetical protein